MNHETITTETAAEAPAAEAAPAAPAAPPVAGNGAAVGRRKKATARARIQPGTGKVTVNGRTLDRYFANGTDRTSAMEPLADNGAASRYDVTVLVTGGGRSGQAGAMCLAIARALSLAEPSMRATLRGDGSLTRDARRKERKKYGRRGARRGFQFSKR
ncbi:MAG: 30S ribosomal protein S9 [Planctomycetes bacterium]|nr:30S ribosomal protein S9 [Planctomycetota bacterium]